MAYSLKEYFGGKGEAYNKYKEGQKAGKWADLPDYISKGGSQSGSTGSTSSATGSSLLDQQSAREEDFLKRYRETLAGQTSLSDIYSRLSTEAGLPELQKGAFQAQQAVTQVPETEATLSKQFGISAPRLQKRISEQLSTLQPQALRAAELAQFASQDVSQRLGLEAAEQERALKPFEVEAAQISERAAREMTGYSIERQGELDQLLTKLNQQGSLDYLEAQRVASLASSELEFDRQRELISFETDEAIRQALATKSYGTSQSPYGIFGASSGGTSFIPD